jgi:hypothetical protein
VEAKRVPGNFHVQFTHESFNFENALINATHAINHLSFGTPLPKATRKWIEYGSRLAWPLSPRTSLHFEARFQE